MSKPMTNAMYRKSRGTDKPFSGSEEQTQAIWTEQIRKAKYRPTPKAAPAAEPKPQDGPVGG